MSLGPIFTAIGESGSQLARAKLAAAQYRLQQLFDKLGLEEGQERLRRLKLTPVTEEERLTQTFAGYEKVLGRKLTEQEKGLLLGLKPTVQNLLTPEAIQEWAKSIPDDKQRDLYTRVVKTYVQSGDYEKAMNVMAQAAERFKPPTKEKPERLPVFDQWRLAFIKRRGREPSDEEILRFHRQERPSAEPDQEGIQSYVDSVKAGEITDTAKIPQKIRSRVLAEMHRQGVTFKTKTKLTSQEQNAVGIIQQGLPMMDQVIAQLEPHKGEASIIDAGKVRANWFMYNHGLPPSTTWLTPYFQISALVRVMNTQQFLRGIRNMNFVQQIQQHMPNPERDTPALAHEKAVRMRALMQQMLREYTSLTGKPENLDAVLDELFGPKKGPE